MALVMVLISHSELSSSTSAHVLGSDEEGDILLLFSYVHDKHTAASGLCHGRHSALQEHGNMLIMTNTKALIVITKTKIYFTLKNLFLP